MKETMALLTYGFTTRALTVERHDEFSATTGAVQTCCVVLTIMQYSEQCLQPHDYLHQFVSCPPLWASLYVMLHIALTPSCPASVEFSLNSWLLDRKSLVLCHVETIGYSLLSFTRASSVVNCQCALACFSFRWVCHAWTLLMSVALAAIRPPRH
jgi:hypothetical protein